MHGPVMTSHLSWMVPPGIGFTIASICVGCGGDATIPASGHGQAGTLNLGGAAQGGSGSGALDLSGGRGGRDESCGPDCWTCCNDTECPRQAPSIGDSCSNDGGQTHCSYVADDGCLYHYFCGGGTQKFSMSVEPMDCPNTCPEHSPSYSPAPCLDVGKECPYGPPDRCWLLTCEADHIWNNSIPCP